MLFGRSYKFILTSSVAFLLAGCYPWRSSSLSNVNSAEKELQEAKQTGKLDSKVIDNAIKAYHFFVMYYPYDSITPAFAYREGELYQMEGEYKKAINTLSGFEKLYPKARQVPNAIFLMAAIDEQNINDHDSADTLYAKLLFTYPDSKAAEKTHDLFVSKGISSEDFYKKYSKAFLKAGNSEKADSTQQSVRYHAYWKRQ